MKRRDILRVLGLGLASVPSGLHAGPRSKCKEDGTPAQFLPKNAPDSRANENDIKKYPKCPYCGMDRQQFHHSRMLILYTNEVPDAVCSLHCAAISLAINIDAEPKGLWVADSAPNDETKPLVDALSAVYLIGGSMPGVMTMRSKIAFGSEAAARAAQAAQGGETGDFNKALEAAYLDMARDVARIRKNREERRNRAKAGTRG